MKRYGIEVPDDWSDLQVELAALEAQHSVKNGGLGHQGHLRNVMMMLWPHKYAGMNEHGVPKWNDYAELLTWAWCEYDIVSAFGHASAAKSHTLAHIVAAEYLCSPYNTAAVLTSTHIQGLRNRIFQYVFDAVREIRHLLELRVKRNPTPVVSMPDIEDDKNVIQGIATNRGDEAVTKIQGIHTSRVFIVIDEAAGTPQAIFDAAANLQVGTRMFRQVMLMNPDDTTSHAATWAEPAGGFEEVGNGEEPWWETARGGVAVHFSWDRCPNKKHGKTVYPYLLSQDDVDRIIERYGADSPQYYTFALGWFPPAGLQGYVFSPSILSKAETEFDFPYPPVKIAAMDPAFEGGDQTKIAFADYYPDTNQLNLVDICAIKVNISDNEPMDYLTAQATKRLCQERGVRPDNFIMDTTGGGRGVYNFLAREWGADVQRCDFGGAATERRVRPDDPITAKEQTDRFVSELWWCARAFCEEGLVGGVDKQKFRDLHKDLLARRYDMKRDRLVSVEPKRDMKKRLGHSPDDGDAFCLLIELVRRFGGEALSGSTPRDQMRPLAALAQETTKFLVESWET